MDIVNNLGITAITERLVDDTTRPALNEYLHSIKRRYFIPGRVGLAIRATARTDNILSEVIVATRTEDEYTEMLRQFEQTFLGLPPGESTDGVRWWAGNAGGSGGVYPAESIADLFDFSVPDLLDYIKDNKSPGEFVIARADKYLIPMTDNNNNNETVMLDGIEELTPQGEEFVEAILMAYEQGYNDASQA